MLAMSTTSACIARPVARVSVAAARSTRAAATVGVKTVHVGVKIHGTSAMNVRHCARAGLGGDARGGGDEGGCDDGGRR